MFSAARAVDVEVLSAKVLPVVLLYVHPLDITGAFLTCKRWWRTLHPGCRLWRDVLARRNLPVPDGFEPYDAFKGYWFLLRCATFAAVPTFAQKPSLYRSAQVRLNSGCVLEVSAEYSTMKETEWPHLLFRIKSGVKSTIHKVTAQYLGRGKVDLPECDCFNKNVREHGAWCSHMLVVFLFFERMSLGFESFKIVTEIPKMVEPARKAEYMHIAKYYEGKEVRRVLQRRLEKVLHETGLWETSKLAYLKSFGLTMIQVETRPIGVRLFDPQKPKYERKKRRNVTEAGAAIAVEQPADPRPRRERKKTQKALDEDEYIPENDRKGKKKKKNKN